MYENFHSFNTIKMSTPHTLMQTIVMFHGIAGQILGVQE